MKQQASNDQSAVTGRKLSYAPPTLTALGSAVGKTRSSNQGNVQEVFSENISWTTN